MPKTPSYHSSAVMYPFFYTRVKSRFFGKFVRHLQKSNKKFYTVDILTDIAKKRYLSYNYHVLNYSQKEWRCIV